MPSSAKTTIIPKGHGLRRLLAEDPSQFLLYAVEQVQEQAHYRRVGRVLRASRRRRERVGWVHVSDTLKPCDRVIGARLLGYQMPDEKPGMRMRRIFDNGNFMHLRWQNYFASLPPAFTVSIAPMLRDWPVVGEADVIVRHEHFGLVVVELKSINSHNFSRLRTSQPEHLDQVNMYAGMAAADGAQVWYENKDDQDVKTYSHESDKQRYQDMMERVRAVAEEVRLGKLPQACGQCDLDEYIGNRPWDESRLVRMEAERAEWLKKNQS